MVVEVGMNLFCNCMFLFLSLEMFLLFLKLFDIVGEVFDFFLDDFILLGSLFMFGWCNDFFGFLYLVGLVMIFE